MTNTYLRRILFVFTATLAGFVASAQQLKVKDFAVWGGSASASNYNNSQGVFFSPQTKITGNVGSTQQIQGQKGLQVTGNLVSGNAIVLADNNVLKGDLIAAKKATNYVGNVISAGFGSSITGNITGNGRIGIKNGSGSQSSFVTGSVKLPSPTTSNYTGPIPQGGFYNVFDLPLSPVLPDNTPFDTKSGTKNITTSQTILPGAYRTLSVPGGKTLVFSGPGNYIFYNVDNRGNNTELIFDFKGTTEGSINIYIVADANWGKIAAQIINGGSASRVFTEVHGNGSTNGGNAFEVKDGISKSAAGVYNWIGAVWAPNGAINIGSVNNGSKGQVTVAGALWSGTKVTLDADVFILYQTTAVEQNFIAPYYPPPGGGKVSDANKKIGAELFSLSQNTGTISTIINNNIFRIVGNLVLIDVISKKPNDAALLQQLQAAGLTGIINNGPDRYVITGYFPIASLPILNTYASIVYVRPSFPPISNAGQVASQGDTTMRSHFVRNQFGLDGEGVKIGVFSDSYNAKGAAQHDVDEDDLPGVKSTGQPNDNPEQVQVVEDLTDHNDEGRAMLQILHDVAPKAKLAFKTGFLTAGHFAGGIKALSSPDLPGGRCDILVDDITYITEPFLRDGIVAKTVDTAVMGGVTYFTSAGNFGNRSYENGFRGVPATAIVPSPATLHQFGPTTADVYQRIKLKPGNYTIVLQWTDDFSSLGSTQGVQSDLDLYLLNSTGFTLFGFNRSNLFGDPFEVCPFTVTEETEAKLIVVNANGTTNNVRFKYIIFGGDGTILDYQAGGSTIVGHANSDSAIAVGAMLYANIPQYTPIYPSVASFSSRGGTQTLNTTNVFVDRKKPDLIAPNGVNTSVNLGGPVFNDGDDFPNFFGTSAAAPHAAGAAALYLQALKKYNLQRNVTPRQIRNGLQNTTGRFAGQTAAYTPVEGYGFVQADSAVERVANPRPILRSWEPAVAGTQPGSSPFTVKVKGAYFTETSTIYFDGKPLRTTVAANKTEATATVPAITRGQNPPLQIGNVAKSPSGLDGGLSEDLRFFSTRATVTIKADNKNRKYGQENPFFTSHVLINGVPIEQTTVTLADLKLDGENLTYSTFATSESDAGLYSITPARTAALAADDPLLVAYRFTLEPGTLRIDKMPLKITPLDKIVRYGDDLGEVNFDYAFDNTQAISSGLLDRVKATHKRYLANNALIVMNGYESSSPAAGPPDLTNSSFLASFQSIKNGRQYLLNNGQLQAVKDSVPTDSIGKLRYLVDLSVQSFLNYKLNAAQSTMVPGSPGANARALLSIKSLANGSAKAAVPNGQLQPMVNGQLLAMVNGQLQAVVNGQLRAFVNGVWVDAADFIFQNGQLLGLVNGQWLIATNGQIQAIVNGQNIIVDLSIVNGQLQAVVNDQIMALVNGQLRAVVNGQLLAVVNGQLQAVVNGQLMPVVNGQLLAMVNGQLRAVVNGQLLAVVNGQLMAVVNGVLELVESLTILSNGQLQAVVNGQIQPIVNGQLKALVNGVLTDVPNPTFVNGQLQAVVNGQLQAVVNGQLRAIVNGQIQPIVNGDLVPVTGVKQVANGQLRGLVNGVTIPLQNGQLQAVVNGQLLGLVNGQLMAVVNGELTFVVFKNGQLRAVVNGQLQPVVNGQLRAVVNGEISPVISYSISNGQLRAVVNGQLMGLVNNQLLAFANGQLQPVVNNFDVSGTNNNANTMVLADQDDINIQGGAIGGMFSVNMITGLNVGNHKLCAGAFLDNNFEVSYGVGNVQVLPRPLVLKADDVTKLYGDQNPALTITGTGFSFDETLQNITTLPSISVAADATSSAGQYPILLQGGEAVNYSLILQDGILNINKRPLTIVADDKSRAIGQPNPPFTLTYKGFVNGDTEYDVCSPIRPTLPKAIRQLERTATYTNVKLLNASSESNFGTNELIVSPGASVILTADWSSITDDGVLYCPGCITQNYIGIAGSFSDCHDVSGTSLVTGSIYKQFTAPEKPGVYYITQIASWEYNCYDRGTGYNFDNSNAADAIAVLVVQTETSNTTIVANTTADVNSPAGAYPITLTGCNSTNYEISYIEGTLQVIGFTNGALTKQRKAAAAVEEETSTRAYVAPNPATSFLQVQMRGKVAGTPSIFVLDALGRLQAVQNIRKVKDNVFQLDVSSLPKGAYILRVGTNGKEETFKFIKL